MGFSLSRDYHSYMYQSIVLSNDERDIMIEWSNRMGGGGMDDFKNWQKGETA